MAPWALLAIKSNHSQSPINTIDRKISSKETGKKDSPLSGSISQALEKSSWTKGSSRSPFCVVLEDSR